MWISVLVLIPTEMDKSFVADMAAIAHQYRMSLKTSVDPVLYAPETSLPYIIDLLSQTFAIEGKIKFCDTRK